MTISANNLITAFGGGSISNLGRFGDTEVNKISLEPHRYLGSSGKERFAERRLSCPIEFIVVHYTVSDFTKSLKILAGVDLDNPQNPLDDSEEKQVSVHYMVPKKENIQESASGDGENGYLLSLVPAHYKAHHTGVGAYGSSDSLNSVSLGIEIINNGIEDFEQHQMDVLLGLCINLFKEYENLTPLSIIGHSDLAAEEGAQGRYVLGRKQDPGTRFDWGLFYKNMADSLGNQNYRSEGFMDMYKIFDNPVKDSDFFIGNRDSNYDASSALSALHNALSTEDLKRIAVSSKIGGYHQTASYAEEVIVALDNGKNPFEKISFAIDFARNLLGFVGYIAYSEDGKPAETLGDDLSETFEQFNRHYAPSVFKDELVVLDGVVEDPLNKRMYLQSFIALLKYSGAVAKIRQAKAEKMYGDYKASLPRSLTTLV